MAKNKPIKRKLIGTIKWEFAFCALCTSLKDNVELIDAGNLEDAKALLNSILERARRLAKVNL